MEPAAALTKVSPMRWNLSRKAFGSSHLPVSDPYARPVPRDASPAAQADAHAALLSYFSISRAIEVAVSAGTRYSELALRQQVRFLVG
jgi:hypothetical protein